MTASLLNEQELTISVISLLDRKLIFPTSAVIDTSKLIMPQLVAKMPTWFLGYLPWQGLRIPFISFEAASESHFKINGLSRIVVLKTITPRLTDKFFALLIQKIPQTLTIHRDNLRDVVAELAPFELDTIRIKQADIDIIGKIPDILALEHLMSKTGVLH